MSRILKPESLKTILSKPLVIPNYQRPYKWKVKNVLNLITDIEQERHNKVNDNSTDYRYRIGSIILHDENGKTNIVDGQQRLLSICLILFSIAKPEQYDNICLLSTSFSNQITLDNLKYNLQYINKYFRNWQQKEKENFVDYLLNHCEMIIIEASNIAESFQLFDSQNARGKTLEPADLLKAYHLRSMNDDHEKRMCVQRWEEAIDRKILHHVLSKVIYRCRCWMRRDYDKYEFSNETIDEFKGIDVNIFNSKSNIFPYMEKLYVMSQFDAYSIDEPIVNGKRFFDYVEHYVAMYEELFPAINDRQVKKTKMKLDRDNNFQDLTRALCFYSPKMNRTGDSRLRNVLFCLLMSYYDKFGKIGYEEFFSVIYQYVFHLRIELSQIRRESIRDYILMGCIPGNKGKCGNQINPFEWINNNYQAIPSELRTLLRMPEKAITIEELNGNVKN